MKRHDQYCPIARTLDLVGDRWSMLVIRELSFGDARFSALRRNLAGVSPTLLTERLQTLAAQGLVAARIQAPAAARPHAVSAARSRVAPGRWTRAPSAARTAYTLTPKGREALPILRAMARFGMALLPSPRRARGVRPETAAHAAVRAFYDAAAADGIDERYRLVLDGKTFDLASARGDRAANAGTEPDLVLTGSARTVIAVRRGETTLADAIASGALAARGSKRALRHFQRVYRLP